MGSSDSSTAIVAGAVVGAFVGALLIALLVITVMALTFMKHRKTKPEGSFAAALLINTLANQKPYEL